MELCARAARATCAGASSAPLSGASGQGPLVCCGDSLLAAHAWQEDGVSAQRAGAGALRGHGTRQAADGELRATLVGASTTVNRLIMVSPLRGRYVPQVGDVVVGRVAAVGRGAWQVDVGARALASLALSAVELPGAAQRLRTASDELRMREDLAEGDALVAEVQSVAKDGVAQLHTRGKRYGQCGAGCCLRLASASLTPRTKRHVAPPGGASGAAGVVCGANGRVWCGDLPGGSDASAAGAAAAHRAAAAAKALGDLELPVTVAAIEAALALAEAQGVLTADLAAEPFRQRLLQAHTLN